MFYAYDTRSGETSSSSDQTARERKFPRLAATTFQPSSPYDPPSTMSSNHLPFDFHTEFSPMEVGDTPLSRQIDTDENEQCFVKHRRRRTDDTGSHYGSEHGSFSSAYRAPIPSYYNTTTETSCVADALSTPQFHHRYPSSLQGGYDAQPEEFPHLRTQPSSCHTSSPRSTTVSPRELIDTFPLPIQPSPSLPLHQPRPSRRIPIISLSQLASACENTEPASRRTSAAALKPRTEVLPSDSWQSPYPNYDHDKVFFASSTIREDNKIGRVLQCSCGCMETYAVG